MKLPLIVMTTLIVAAALWAQQRSAAVIMSPASQMPSISAMPELPVMPRPAAPEPLVMSTPMQATISQVAAAYEHISQFPPYSIPLSEQQTELLEPNAGATNARDLSPIGLPGELVMTLSAFRYKVGDEIEATIVLSGDDSLFTQLAPLRLFLEDDDGKRITQLTARAQQNRNEWQWQSKFDAKEAWQGSLNIVAELVLTDGAYMQQRVPFEVFDAVAEITGLGSLRVENNELIIPVQIADAEPGFYKLAASLHRADQSPLGYLQAQARVSGSGTIELKAHGMLLHTLTARQALWLGNFQLRKMPERPGPDIAWGFSRDAFYRTDEVDPARFSGEPYQDEQTAMRLQFLQSLANPSNP